MYRNILNIAKLYRNEVIYFPTFLDFRGRVYPLVNYLTYQGGDIARSLLLFHMKGKKTLNINYLYIYLSNVFGGNKLSRASRIA
jgi:DNA-directed RNA polymerase